MKSRRQQQQQDQTPFQDIDWQQWIDQIQQPKPKPVKKSTPRVPPIQLPPLIPIGKKKLHKPQKQATPRQSFFYNIPQQQRPPQMILPEIPLSSGRRSTLVLPPLKMTTTPRQQERKKSTSSSRSRDR